MENKETHSKAKLALAAFTSPGAAFEEIISRKLLGTAFFIVLLAGLVSAAPVIAYGLSGDHLKYFLLSRYNPIIWLGLCMLYTFAMQKMLKWLGPDVSFTDLFILMGWSQLALIVAKLAATILSIIQIGGSHTSTLSSFLMAVSVGFPVWYVALVGLSVMTLSRLPIARGIMCYIVIEVAAMLGFSFTYSNARMGSFAGAVSGVQSFAGSVVAIDQYPWLIAGVAGLVIGTWFIGKYLGWSVPKAKQIAAAAGVLGLIVLSVYAFGMTKTDYYGKLARAQRAYDNDNYSLAATRFGEFLPLTKENIDLRLDIADMHYLASEDEQALNYYGKVAAESSKEDTPINNARFARASDGIGTIYYFQGKLKESIAEYEKASKAWPEFKEPWVRMIVTYDKMGEYKKAVKSADKAMKERGSDAKIAWVAAAEAYTQTKDKAQAGAAIKIIESRDTDLVKRIAPKSQDWGSAVDRLTREDLKFPLEKEPVQPPAKPKAKGQKRD